MSLCRFALGLLLLSATRADAQLIQFPAGTDPSYWVSGSIGLFQVQTVADGATQSAWDFGTAAYYRISVDRELGNGTSAGLTLGRSRAPLTYIPNAGALGGSCPTACDAQATIWNALAGLHIGGGAGVHQILDLAVGVTRYTDFRADGSGARLAPDGDTDLSFVIGYGLGFPLGPRFQINFVQDAGLSLHQRTGLSGNSDRTTQQLNTRLGIRYGVGHRAVR